MLFEEFSTLEKNGILNVDIPHLITGNLRYNLRPYQEKALKRFIYYHEGYTLKKGNHLLFEMATGTGKTLMMASLMLYLKSKGHSNFIFFVNSTNIVEKTKQNFIDKASSKYLFTEDIVIDAESMAIKAIDSLEDTNDEGINILFTTIQGLHIQLKTPKENSFTLDDFKTYKVVLLADEAHHITATTKSSVTLEASWEESVSEIFSANRDNHLLEFTATAELEKTVLKNKYADKVIIQYGLKAFREEGYSKNIFLSLIQKEPIDEKKINPKIPIAQIPQEDFTAYKRSVKFYLLMPLIFSQYRQEIAGKYQVPLKPVILFKSRTIKLSEVNHKVFNQVIDELSVEDMDYLFEVLKAHQKTPIYQHILDFFTMGDFSKSYLCDRLQKAFNPDIVLNANSDSEVEQLQIRLNSLENRDNRYRVIFAVNKLNEGWDVLNLYDIVKLYETNISTKKPPTAQEIQLIGRGARLYPYRLREEEPLYKRKFDSDLDHEAVVLEQLHFHTADGSEFIRQLNEDLEQEGLINRKDYKEVTINLKEAFKASAIYKSGRVFLNKQVKNSSKIGQRNLLGEIEIDKNLQEVYGAYEAKIDMESIKVDDDFKQRYNAHNVAFTDLTLERIPEHIFLKALAKVHKYFDFDKIAPKIALNRSTVMDLKTVFKDNRLRIYYPKGYDVKMIKKNPVYLLGVCVDFLQQLSDRINSLRTTYKGKKSLEASPINKLFKSKRIVVKQEDSFIDGHAYSHFAQDKFKGTSYEKEVIGEICNYFQDKALSPTWLIRNERDFQIYNLENGRGFEPDFLLMVTQPQKEQCR